MSVSDVDGVEDDLLVEVGTEVQVPLSGMCRDPELYPRPDAFDPQRFLAADGRKEKERFLGFGLGPRACPGRDFAMLQIKAGLAALLARWDKSIELLVPRSNTIKTLICRFRLEASPRLTAESADKVGQAGQPLWVRAVPRAKKETEAYVEMGRECLQKDP